MKIKYIFVFKDLQDYYSPLTVMDVHTSRFLLVVDLENFSENYI